jgi:hypothetical protein
MAWAGTLPGLWASVNVVINIQVTKTTEFSDQLDK